MHCLDWLNRPKSSRKPQISLIFLSFLISLFLTGCSGVTGNVVREYTQETEVYFCPTGGCREVFINALQNANKIECAIYDVDIPELADLLVNKKARVVLDDESSLKIKNAVIDPKYTQMHNKFCILNDETVITGSMNPTVRDTSMNNNNLLILHSEDIAHTYEAEFEELYNKTFSGGESSSKNTFYINNDVVSVYFCPEEWCANKILYALNTAKESIYFMTFSFTHDQIGDLLIKKSKEGIIVKGVMEKTQNNAYAEFKKLNETGIDVIWDKNKANMHHKVFIIDRKIVVTGSMNPTLNGDTANDENLLVIESPALAAKYLSEFDRVYLWN